MGLRMSVDVYPFLDEDYAEVSIQNLTEEQWGERFCGNDAVEITAGESDFNWEVLLKFVGFVKALDPSNTPVKHIEVNSGPKELLDALLPAFVPLNLKSLWIGSRSECGYDALKEVVVAGKLPRLCINRGDVLAEVIERNGPSMIHLTSLFIYDDSPRLLGALKHLPSLKELVVHGSKMYKTRLPVELLKGLGGQIEVFGWVHLDFAADVLKLEEGSRLSGLLITIIEEAAGSPQYSDKLCSALADPKCTLQHLTFSIMFGPTGPSVINLSQFLEVCLTSPQLTSLELASDGFDNTNDTSKLNIPQRLFNGRITRFKLHLYSRDALLIMQFLNAALQSLQSNKSTLQHLTIQSKSYPSPEMMNPVLVQIVGYLESNFQCPLETLRLKGYEWPSAALEDYCRQILARNKMYREGGLGEEDQVEPLSAKLFICGDTGAGKSTIRRNLVSRLPSCKRLLSTFGIDMATLTFRNLGNDKKKKKKLIICDLAGQPEFHGFHHYFIRGSDKDLFLIVCKAVHPNEQGPSVPEQLEYWLRFLVSHRTLTEHKPKVMIVLNFFPGASVHTSTANLTEAAAFLCETIIGEYSRYISFESDDHGNRNIYGMVAKDFFQVRRLIRPALKENLDNLLQGRPKVPKVCNDLLQVLPRISKKEKVLSVGECRMGFNANVNETLFEVSLKHLHNMGEVIYFAEQHTKVGDLHNNNQADHKEYVILDVQWFVRDIIGLFIPRLSRSSPEQSVAGTSTSNIRTTAGEEGIRMLGGEMDRGHAKEKLFSNGCNKDHIPYILRSLEKMGVLLDNFPNPTKVTVISFLPEKKLEWPQHAYDIAGGSKDVDDAMYWGRRLDCKDKTTLLPSAIFAMLQVELKNTFHSQVALRGWINLVEDGIGIIVQVGGSRRKWYDRHWIDILVQIPLHRVNDVYLDRAEAALNKVKQCVFKICHSYNWGCPLVELVEKVIQPKSVQDFTCSKVSPLSEVLEEADVTQDLSSLEHTWPAEEPDKRLECTPLYRILLPSERAAKLQKKWEQLKDLEHQMQEELRGKDDGAVAAVDKDGEGSEEVVTRAYIDRKLKEMQLMLVKEIQDGVAQILNAVERLKEIVVKETQLLRFQGNRMLAQILVNSTSMWPKYPYLLEQNTNKLERLITGNKYKLYCCCEYGHCLDRNNLLSNSKHCRDGDVVHDIPTSSARGFPITVAADWFDEGSAAVLRTTIRTVFVIARVARTVLPLVPDVEEPLIKKVNSEVDVKKLVDRVFEGRRGRSRATDEDRDRFYRKLQEMEGLVEENFGEVFGLYKVTQPEDGSKHWVCENHKKQLGW